MAKVTRNFMKGRMNKVADQRVIPDGEYVDAMNIRMGSTENSELGAIENTKGNLPLTSLIYINGTALSANARCIGAIQDSARETMYWFVHDPNFTVGATGKLDLIVSYNVSTTILTYNVVSINDGSGTKTTLNFNPSYLITGVDILDDLLFFTDDFNPPRCININRNYADPVSNIDQFSAESILVIKKPPVQSPVVQPIATSGQENYLDTRFICFAYRYRYIDNEFSATSQWSQPAFVPKPFEFSTSSYLNEGMTNLCNSAIVTYNSGGPLVVGIDLLFKRADGNVIKVIERLDKANLGLANNTNYQFTFTNSKIFTILSESELLRLYDNVPNYAKAQTIMGNRLMYGNYIEGYDLVDSFGVPLKLEYTVGLTSTPIGYTVLEDDAVNGTYSINGARTVVDSVVSFDLVGQALTAGSIISLDVTLSHSVFSGQTPFPTATTTNVDINFVFNISKDYASVFALATSPEFQNAVGTISNIETVANACGGITFTDAFNCAIPSPLGGLLKKASGISAVAQPIGIVTTPASSSIGLQFPAMQFVNNLTTPTQTVYEYYQVVNSSATFQEIANNQSLHSNRDYEIGIVYMDDYNRSSTALVSPNNTQHVGCGLSASQNALQVTIPPSQVPPYWATRYKFVIKSDLHDYETIYSSIFFQDPISNSAYFLLEGENARKVEVGDRLIVKTDSNGASSGCVYATVLEKSSQSANFIEIPSELDPDVMIPIPAGVYMKMNPSNFNIVTDELAIIAPGLIGVTENTPGEYPILYYPMNYYDTVTSAWIDYTVPTGSKIVVSFKQFRAGVGNDCEERTNTLIKTFTSSKSYDNMYDWFVGDSISLYLNDGERYAGAGAPVPDNEFISTVATTAGDILTDLLVNYYKFFRDASTNQLQLMVTGTERCGGIFAGDSRASNVQVDITVFRAEKNIVFETEPLETLPDVFFENEMSFAITNGNHMGNIQNQNIATNTPAIVDTKFFNCFAFGNGIESYKIRDSIVGTSFNFGNRVTTVSEQDYQQAHRFADITYSGIYNAESNVNKLNEFNLGLLNFKRLEVSFGNIQIMDGRQTDVLVLQEDKISYVLSGKNLLSDSVGGGAISSVPEVLGTQIARSEKYGISFNPESYVQWGYNRYFTDVKRGAVLAIKGDSYSQDQLVVISEMNMRTWFRDNFNESFNTQKLGGFDPYSNEYVLCTNTIALPSNEQCLDCGISQTFTLSTPIATPKTYTYCVDLGATVGSSFINYVVSSVGTGANFTVSVNYNGTVVSSGVVTTSGTITFNKNLISVETATVTITYIGTVNLSVSVGCPTASTLNIVQIVFTNDYDAGQSIHAEYKFTNGTFTSPTQSSAVLFQSGSSIPLVSRYNITSNLVGTGGFPPAGSTMNLATNKIGADTFVFDPATDKFKYHSSNTLYNNTSAQLLTLLGLATTATPNQGGGNLNFATFTTPSLANYLYLIWDFRQATSVSLRYSATTARDACCVASPAAYFLNAPSLGSATSIFTNSTLSTVAANGFYSDGIISRQLVDGVLLPQQTCDCSVLTTYYELSECGGGTGYAYTSIDPTAINRRYVLPTGPVFYIYTGATLVQSTPPPAFNGSIQITAFYNCP
jgi:hypothetical protein